MTTNCRLSAYFRWKTTISWYIPQWNHEPNLQQRFARFAREKVFPQKVTYFFASWGGGKGTKGPLVFARGVKVPLIFEAIEGLVRFWGRLGYGARSHIFTWFGPNGLLFRSCCVEPVENPTFSLLVRSVFAKWRASIWMGRRTKKHTDVRWPTGLTQSKFPRYFEAFLNQFDEDSS